MNDKEIFLDSYYKQFNELYDISKKELEQLYDENTYSGYPIEPGGSVWVNEGKALYCSIRITKPSFILEIGNFKGVSTNHILLAVENNNYGEVHLVDIEDQLNYEKLHNRNFERYVDDSLSFLNKELSYDYYVQDGCHEYNHVKEELQLIINNTQNNFHIWSHDYYTIPRSNVNVYRAWEEMKNEFKNFSPMKEDRSDCGFVLAEYVK